MATDVSKIVEDVKILRYGLYGEHFPRTKEAADKLITEGTELVAQIDAESLTSADINETRRFPVHELARSQRRNNML